MANQTGNSARKSIGKFTRTVLASTCLTLASAGAVSASTIYVEGEGGLPSEFSDSSSSPTQLGADPNPGTTTVEGILEGQHVSDWFELIGLGIGDFTVTETNNQDLFISIFDSSLNQIGSAEGSANFGPDVIPEDGNLIFGMNLDDASGGYTVTVNTTSATPEPSTAVGLSSGLAGLVGMLALRRKLKR